MQPEKLPRPEQDPACVAPSPVILCEERSDVAIRRAWYGIPASCRICNSAAEGISICNAKKNGRYLLYIRYDEIAHCKCLYS
jgi:hypothetical protein